tara:strand:+ start:76264 stop:77814 length:1551 start_codon:yes stop_codon:yes gene_type:complete
MKRALLLFLAVSIIGSNSFGQTYADDVAQLVFDNCASCHNPDGIAPFSLMNYQDVTANSAQIYDAIAQDRMPPWPPNENYKEFSHSRALEGQEKTMILDWLSNGMPEGDPNNTPAPPVFDSGAILGAGDLEVQIPTYTSKATSFDDYVCFSLPSNLAQGRTIKAMEVVPGNAPIVHHALVYIDESATYATDTVGGDCAGPTNAKLVGGYTPGATPLVFPNGSGLKLGMDLPANSNIVLAMHYPAGSNGMKDSTKVIFHFYDEPVSGVREISAEPILQNWSFTLPPEQITEVSASYSNIPIDVSILSIFPHMHLLGDQIKSYGLDTNNDTIRMIDIPHWDFEWQDFYMFKNMVKIPANSTLHADGAFNNTAANDHNPNNPAITVYPGLNTTDEMFLVYFHYLAYEQGDENYNIEDLTSLSVESYLDNTLPSTISVFPNPVNEVATVSIQGKQGDNILSASVYDIQGRKIETLAQGLHFTNQTELTWNTTNGSGLKSGVYYLSIRLNGVLYDQKIVKN